MVVSCYMISSREEDVRLAVTDIQWHELNIDCNLPKPKGTSYQETYRVEHP